MYIPKSEMAIPNFGIENTCLNKYFFYYRKQKRPLVFLEILAYRMKMIVYDLCFRWAYKLLQSALLCVLNTFHAMKLLQEQFLSLWSYAFYGV